MKRFLPILSLIILLFHPKVRAQSNQTVTNGGPTTAVTFPAGVCSYTWTNNNTGVGLPASGAGNISSFTAVNTGNSPITATITATPVSPGLAYIADFFGSAVSVVNLSNYQSVANIPVSGNPLFVVPGPNGTVYVACNNSANSVTVLNTSTNAISATITGVSTPDALALSKDGSTLYVANGGNSTVSFINTATNVVSNSIVVGQGPDGLVVSPDGTELYVANEYSNSISVISTATEGITSTIPLPANTWPEGLAISPDGTTLYVANAKANTVSVINLATATVTATIPTAKGTSIITMSADGSTIYVSDETAGIVTVISTATDKIITTINVPNACGSSLSADGSLLYVTSIQSNEVYVISTTNYQVVTTFSVGDDPVSFGNFVVPGAGCGAPVTFTITVDPTPAAIPPSVQSTAVSGSISACSGAASISPYIAQITVSGSNLTGDITVNAPGNFQVSTSPSSNFASSLTLSPVAGAVSNTTIYIGLTAGAPVGSVPGSISITSPGVQTQQVTVTGTVNASPTIVQPGNQTVYNAGTTTAVNFSTTGDVVSWTNNQPGIGLPATGLGDIPAFTTINTGTSPLVATVTATPASIPYAYIANSGSDNVSVIDLTTNTITATINVQNYPDAVAISPDNKTVYVGNQRANSISVISTLSNTVVGVIQTTGESPTALTVSPDGKRLYVVNLNSNSVSVVSTGNYSVLTNIPVGGYPVAVAVTPDGSLLYVSNSSNSVSVIDATSFVTKATIPVGTSPYGLAVSPDGSKVYVAVSGANTVAVVSTATQSVLTTIPVGINPSGVALSPNGTTLYVSNQTSNNVSVVNTATNSLTATVAVGNAPVGLSVTSDGSALYVANQRSNSVSVVNTAANTVSTTVSVGQFPISLGNFITAGAGCTGIPVSFTITVNPTAPVITVTGSLLALTTVYGTPSSSEMFTVSAQGLTAGVLVTAPAGFEVSTDNNTFSPTITVGSSGALSAQSVYIRLAATTPVGDYGGNIVLTSPGATTADLLMPQSTVTPALLTIIADNKTKPFGTPIPTLTASYVGFVNYDTPKQLTQLPQLSVPATASSPVGTYPITASDASSPNYIITYLPGTLTILLSESAIVIPNAFTPNGDGVNDTWQIRYLSDFINCSVDIFTRWGQKVYSSIGYDVPWDGTYKGASLPVGTYYYIINLKNGSGPLSGFVAIIK